MVGAAILLAMPATSLAQYSGWQHDASLFVLTTPEGANLPATATVENFPLLVRLDSLYTTGLVVEKFSWPTNL